MTKPTSAAPRSSALVMGSPGRYTGRITTTAGRFCPAEMRGAVSWVDPVRAAVATDAARAGSAQMSNPMTARRVSSFGATCTVGQYEARSGAGTKPSDDRSMIWIPVRCSKPARSAPATTVA